MLEEKEKHRMLKAALVQTLIENPDFVGEVKAIDITRAFNKTLNEFGVMKEFQSQTVIQILEEFRFARASTRSSGRTWMEIDRRLLEMLRVTYQEELNTLNKIANERRFTRQEAHKIVCALEGDGWLFRRRNQRNGELIFVFNEKNGV